MSHNTYCSHFRWFSHSCVLVNAPPDILNCHGCPYGEFPHTEFDDAQPNESYVDYRKRMESYEVSEPIKPKVVRKPSRFDGII